MSYKLAIVDFDGTLETRAYENELPVDGVFEAEYTMEFCG